MSPPLKTSTPSAVTRQVIKSDFATVTFQEIEFQIPPRQRGEVTTVEGLLRTSAEKLGEAQDLRMERSPEVGGGGGGSGDGDGDEIQTSRGGNEALFVSKHFPCRSSTSPRLTSSPKIYITNLFAVHFPVVDPTARPPRPRSPSIDTG